MTSPKILVHLISCTIVHHRHAILVYSLREESMITSDHQFFAAHINLSDTGEWKYRAIADMGRSFYLPQTATRADSPIEHTFTSAVDEAIKIARELGLIA